MVVGLHRDGKGWRDWDRVCMCESDHGLRIQPSSQTHCPIIWFDVSAFYLFLMSIWRLSISGDRPAFLDICCVSVVYMEYWINLMM